MKDIVEINEMKKLMSISKTINLIPLSEEKDKIKLWDNFVVNHPEGRFCHLSGYKKVVENSYNYTPYYYMLEKNGTIVGLIPFFVSKSIFLGKKMVSQPFSEYGGLLLDDMTSMEHEEVFSAVRAVMRQAKAGLAEIHGGFGIPESERNKHLMPIAPHFRAVITLDMDAETFFTKKINRMVRKAVRKAERNNVICYEKSDPEMVSKYFYPLFLLSMKRLGVPAHPLSYYTGFCKHLKDNLKIFWAEYDNKIIAALLGFTVGKGIHIINIVSDSAYWDKRPNDLCHWRFIKWGIENNYEFFDMGSVRYDGQEKFKKKWGIELMDYNHYLINIDPNKKMPSGSSFDSSSKTMRLFSTAWNKCIPLPLTRYIGPIVRKQLAR
ncbi:MAG: GNAT family N-acetyltransferase [candidate division Zixibacteria bacterium]|nr:GNAT family N-acetyltransferase [candidate division Zixibacteria bacterium]